MRKWLRRNVREKGGAPWRSYSRQKTKDQLAYRDVHGEQQIDRSRIEKRISPWPREVLAVVAGILVTVAVWMVWSLVAMGIHQVRTKIHVSQTPAYSRTEPRKVDGLYQNCVVLVDAQGQPDQSDTTCYSTPEEVPEPQWHADAVAREQDARVSAQQQAPGTLPGWIMILEKWKAIVSLLAGLGTWGIVRPILRRNLDAQNLLRDTTDINQYKGDQHLAFPEEVRERFDVVPDVGAHTSVSATTIISHSMLSNKGLGQIEVPVRHEHDVIDETGQVVAYKGEIVIDETGQVVRTKVPMIDEDFGDALWDASKLPKDKSLRQRLVPTSVPYNPGDENRDKLKGYATLADLIKGDWELPDYEPQRPAGVYYVDTSPSNTMILAMTRAGKGQTYIEPMLDTWLRQKRPDNIVVNDPKGELLVKNYVRAAVRGFQVVQFNLINAMKTDIYNPLGMAAEAAREGDQTKCALYVDGIANVFFPVDGAEDPVWPNAANNAFKRAAYGLIDFYLEEERELRAKALRTGMKQKVLEQRLDEMWGKVTLYNCYQLFVQLTSKKVKNPVVEVQNRLKAGEFTRPDGQIDEELFLNEMEPAKAQAFLWEDKPEIDMLTLFFNATEALPQSTMRVLIANANNALRAMAGAEKMLASVYGIAITAMSFFTDPTISTLTSGTPSQNTDLGGLSFPRRFGVRLAQGFTERDHLIGTQALWDAFSDPMFTNPLGKEFEHSDLVSREGWARYYFDGKFPERTSYLRLRLVNDETGILVRTFYFRFTKDYQTSLDGRRIVKDPVTGNRVVRNGVLVELVRRDSEWGEGVTYQEGHVTYPSKRLRELASGDPEVIEEEVPAIISTSVHYAEQPKILFLVTPPHLMKYAKLILILIKQLADLNFDKSYMTKANQKPLYKTRYMLDELGNLQSDGHGIDGFETMLSIGLGQDQQFTLILQTLQQLKDVYGDSVDKIVQGNVANIIFLKSTDDSMIETLSKMSGTKHVAVKDSKTVTRDTEKVIKQTAVEGKVSYTMSTKEEAVVTYNDLAFLPERNSIIFSAGISPIWNRNAEILPMSWRLFQNTIQHPGHSYTLQSIPTLSTAIDFDVRKNQPDFWMMLEKRRMQAIQAQAAMEAYARAYDLDEYGVSRLDPDVYSDGVMALIDSVLVEQAGASDDQVMDEELLRSMIAYEDGMFSQAEENTELAEALEKERQRVARLDERIFAGGCMSPGMLVSESGAVIHQHDDVIIKAYHEARHYLENDRRSFAVDPNGSLTSSDGSRVYIARHDDEEATRRIQQAAAEQGGQVYADGELDLVTVSVTDDFLRFLASLPTWEALADGEFETAMKRAWRAKENTNLS